MSNSAKKEFRFLTQELRAAGTDAKPRIEGYAARYNVKTTLYPGLNEIIRPGAFRNTVAKREPCYCCFQHDQERIISNVGAGTLRLREDELGLYFDSDIDLGVSYASDLYRNIKNGNVGECSFGFTTVQQRYVLDDEDQDYELRELLEVSCFDVSPVLNPQYSSTSVSARSLFPDGPPESVELRCKRVPSGVDVDDRELAAMRARVELAKRS